MKKYTANIKYIRGAHTEIANEYIYIQRIGERKKKKPNLVYIYANRTYNKLSAV